MYDSTWNPLEGLTLKGETTPTTWKSNGNSEYSSTDGLWLIKPHTTADGENIKGDWGLYAAGAYHWDYVASATTLKALKGVAE